jgi:ethanolaminephosphotransferase
MAFGLSLGVYGAFVMDCIFTICDYLDINCLTVKKRKIIDKEVQEGKFKQ